MTAPAERIQCWRGGVTVHPESTAHAPYPPQQPVECSVDSSVPSRHSAASIRSAPVLSLALRRQLTRESLHETTAVVFMAVRTWRGAIFRVAVLKEATKVLRLLLRNVFLSSACAWIVTFFFHFGNPFAIVDSSNQTARTLTVSNLIWSDSIFCMIMVFMHSNVLLPQRFITDPDNPPTRWICVKELVRASYHYCFYSMLMAVGSGFLVGYALPTSMRKYKLDFYLGTAANHVYTTGIDIATRKIYQTKTCQGQERERTRSEKLNATTASPRRRHSSLGSYWKAYIRGSTKLIPTLLAGTYVQVVSQTHLFRQGMEMVAFVIISTAVKILVQEIIKHYVVKHQIKDIRTMCVLVGLPTVLIDTQVRIVLLCQQSNSFAAAGMIAMAVVEIGLRGGKAAILSMELRLRHASMLRQSSTLRQLAIATEPSIVDLRTESTSPAVVVQREFEQLRQLMHRFHAAEASADMHAEYIAIGCSASIWFFYSNHQHYDLGVKTSSTPNQSSMLALFLLIQVGMEIVVDFISCGLEIAAGVDFRSIRKHGSFLAFLFMTTAIINIEISVVLYLS